MSKRYTHIKCNQDDEIFTSTFCTWNITKMLEFIDNEQIQAHKMGKKYTNNLYRITKMFKKIRLIWLI